MNCAIHLSRNVPAHNEVLNSPSHALPHSVGRSVDHLGGKNRIHSERSNNGYTASLLLYVVSAREPLACEENGFSHAR